MEEEVKGWGFIKEKGVVNIDFGRLEFSYLFI